MSSARSRHLTGTGAVRTIRHGRPRRPATAAPDPAGAVWAAVRALDEVLGRAAQMPQNRPGPDIREADQAHAHVQAVEDERDQARAERDELAARRCPLRRMASRAAAIAGPALAFVAIAAGITGRAAG